MSHNNLNDLDSLILSKNLMILIVGSFLAPNDQYSSLFVEWIIKNRIFH